MTFSGFQLFNDFGRQTNFEKVGASGHGVGDLSSYGTLAADTLYGLLPGKGVLSQIIRFGLSNYGYIVDTVTRERLIFQYNVDARESGGAEYTTQATLGRSVPMYTYKGGKDRVLDLPLTFTMKEFTREDVRKAVRFLQALAYPDYSGDNQEINLAPHPVIVVQGKLYTKDLWLVRDFNIEWGQARDPITMLPSEATVNLSLIEISSKGKSNSEVIRL